MYNKRFLFILIAAFATLVSCEKYAVKHNACDGEMKFSPSGYNSDRVTILAPNIVTPNGDLSNEMFTFFSIGIVAGSYEIKRNGFTIFESDSLSQFWQPEQENSTYKAIAKVTTIHGEELKITAKFTTVVRDADNSAIEVKECERCIFPDMIGKNGTVEWETVDDLRCVD